MEPSIGIYGPKWIEYSVLKFSGGEIQVRLLNLNPTHYVTDWSVTLFANITSSDILMELLMVTDALRRAGIKEIHLDVSYFPYARQDRVCNPGEALAVKVVTDIINAQNYETVTILDAHSDVTPALLNKCTNVSAEAYIDYIQDYDQMIFVSPDAGAAKKVLKIAQKYKRPMVTAEKVRDTMTGAITSTKVNIPFEHVSEKDFLIIDDICDGGRTFIELAKELRKQTKGKIILFVTHGIFSAGFDELAKHIDRIYTLNSFVEDVPDFVTILK